MNQNSEEKRLSKAIRSVGKRRLAEAIAGLVASGLFVSNAAAQNFPATLELSSLDGTTGFRLDGVSEDDRSGNSVHGAGDVNGDGIDDVIIGARLADANGLFRAGSSYVVFGRDTNTEGAFPDTFALSSLDGTNGFRLNGIAADDYAGSSVSGAGDVNGDGMDDIIVGAPSTDINGSYGAMSGSSYIVFGKDTASQGDYPAILELSSLDGTNGFRLDGVEFFAQSGISVDLTNDVNGDGLDDILIANFNDGSYVVFGKDTTAEGSFPASIELPELNGMDGFKLDSVGNGGAFVKSISAAGDINGDGLEDLIIGSPDANPNASDRAGSAYVVFGRDTDTQGDFPAVLALSSLNGANGFRLNGVADRDYTGRTVSGAGDINGDGVDDVVISADRADPNDNDAAGSSYIVFGRDTAGQGGFPAVLALASLNGSNGFRLDGSTIQDVVGKSVSAAGDVNGDGLDDLLVGSLANGSQGFYSGSTYVFFGRDTSIQGNFPSTLVVSSLNGANGFRLDGENRFDFAGASVGAAGDFNGDGIDDVIIGAFGADPDDMDVAGSSYVVFGGNDGPGSGRIAVTADQTSIDFGVLDIGQTVSATIVLTNQATTEPVIGNVAVAGSPGFTTLNDDCSGQTLGTNIGVDDACSFDIELTATSGGLLTAQVVAPYNSSLGPEIVLLRAFPDGVFIDSFEN